jgi:hypothetical protein
MTTSGKRRSPGEGTVASYSTKSGLRWYWKTTLTMADGTRKTVWKRGFKTKKAAQDALRAAIVAAAKGEFAEPSKQLTGAYLTEWWPARLTCGRARWRATGRTSGCTSNRASAMSRWPAWPRRASTCCTASC